MGLLDGVMGDSFDDPKTMGLLALAANLSSEQRFMPALSKGLLARHQIISDAEKQKQALEMQGLLKQQHQMALQQAQRQAAMQDAQDKFRASIPSPTMQAAQAALQGGGGPTVLNAQNIRQVDPMAQMMHGAMQSGLVDPVQYLASLQPKPRKLTTVAPGASVIDENDPSKPLFTAPKEDTTPSALKEYQFAKQQGYPGSFLDFQIAQKRAGASQVSVNTGQHGFDNTLKLRTDFRSEPVYKAHQEMQSAYSQIQQSLKAGTPVGDLAGATKIMKLLDPGSVVRESELGMAMASTGLLDRAQNYAKSVITGQKLTPKQREEFQQLADALFAQSANLYNAKRGEYGQIAKRNLLNVEDVIGGDGGVRTAPQSANGALPSLADINAELARRAGGG